jgi:hypothetical protein
MESLLRREEGSAQGVIAKLLLVFVSTVIIGTESHGTHDHILLSDVSGSLQKSELKV